MFLREVKNVLTIVFTIVISSTIFSCRSAKNIQHAISKKDTSVAMIINQSDADSILVVTKTLEEIKNRHINFKTFSAKIKVDYEDSKGKQPGITAYVRILHDSLIWVSMYATVFNIEAMRLLITKDSVFVIDKLNKEAKLRSFDYLQDATQIPVDFKTLQDLIVGNPIYMDANVTSYKKIENRTLLAITGQYFKHLLTLNSENNTLIHSKLDDVDLNRNRTADITYDNYENQGGVFFSTIREITVSEKNKLDVRLNFKQYEFNKDLSITFSIPGNYKRN
ncbi:MAG: DUF4292 domain-containing protein [Sphingobacteriales bacterium]|nr:DUF4292 domain-containing protein [Sphingobacteriales bacterium]